MSKTEGRLVHQARMRRYRSVEEPESCERFFGRHLEILQHFGMTRLASLNRDWFADPFVHVVEIEDLESGELLAGVRLHVTDGLTVLPTEWALPSGPDLRGFMRDHLAEGVGETCGLWVSRRLARLSVVQLLGGVSFALAGALGVRLVLGSCGKYTLATVLGLGGVIEHTFRDYPRPGRTSYLWVMRDACTLAGAAPEYRDLVFDLRHRPLQHRLLEAPHSVLDLAVDVRLPVTESCG